MSTAPVGLPTKPQADVYTAQSVARFICSVTSQSIDAQAAGRARDAISDTIGVALAGSRTDIGRMVYQSLVHNGDIQPAAPGRLFGRSERAPYGTAALYNGIVAHALDYDDASRPSNVHLSGCVVSALVAVVPDDRLLDDEFVLAYLIGHEVGAKIGHVLPKGSRGRPWHATGIIGVFAATAAVSRALGLNPGQIANALGIASSCAAGLHGNVGSKTKSFHTGRSAQAGVTAATLAAQGFDSMPDVLDSVDGGYFHAFRARDHESIPESTAKALAGLSAPWEICTDMGILLKRYPSCAQTQPAIEAAEEARAVVGDEDIESIYVGVSTVTPQALIYPDPTTGLQGKFSMEYVVARALSGQPVVIDAFTDEAVKDPRVRSLMSRVVVKVDPRVADSPESATVIEVVTRSGRHVEKLVTSPKGNGARWMSIDEQRDKFRDTAGRTCGVQGADELFDLLRSPKPEGAVIASRITR